MHDLDRFEGSHPRVSVVICTYKRPKSLLRVLDCLAEQKHTDWDKDHVEVVIVNDGSHDDGGYQDSYDNYPFPVNYKPYPRHPEGLPNLYQIKNDAVQMTTFNEVIWLLDDDLIFDDHTLPILRIYHNLLQEYRVVLVPHYADRREPWHYQNHFPFQVQPVIFDKLRTWCSFAGTSLQKRDWDAVGGIDLRYNNAMGFADLDLGIMLWKDGCNVSLADGISCTIDDSETGSHRDRFVHVKGTKHRNGMLFMEKWGQEEAAKYGVTP